MDSSGAVTMPPTIDAAILCITSAPVSLDHPREPASYFLTGGGLPFSSMTCSEVTVAGIVVPCDAPVFLTIVGLHILIALVCIVTGAVAMLNRKQPGRHPTAGKIYYWSLSLVFVSATTLSVMRWAEDYHLFILGALSFLAATVGREARRRRWRDWVRLHISGMGSSYVLLIVAFYVDNGRNLPIWKDLPPAVYWLLPGAIGGVLIARALLRHPLARRH